MSTLEVNSIQPLSSGSTITLGASGKTLSIPSGCTITNSGTATGFGKVGQIVQANTTTEVSNTTTSYADTGLTASITPTSTSSKILVTVHQNGARSQSDQNNNCIYLKLLRDSTDISQIFVYALYTGSGIDLYGASLSTSFLDSPSTTSATTYKTQFKNFVSGGHVRLQDTAAMSTITLLEIL